MKPDSLGLPPEVTGWVAPKSPELETEITAGQKLAEILRDAGLESTNISTGDDDSEFPEAIIIKREEQPTEKLVRIYRGVNHADASLLVQIPYGMRTEHESGKPEIVEEVRQAVETLAHYPTYENLLAYVEAARPHLSAKEIKGIEGDLHRIEDGILEGYDTRKELIYKQFEHSGGWGDSGISPYVSASFDPHEAAAYGRQALMVIDIPLSQIEDFNPKGEVHIKGALDKKYITGVVLRDSKKMREREERNADVDSALPIVTESTSSPLYSEDEFTKARQAKHATQSEQDKEQWKIDVELVRQKRVADLMKKFPEAGVRPEELARTAAEHGIDIYTKAKMDIFDMLAERLGKIGRGDRMVEDYEYNEDDLGMGESKKFDRNAIDDTMLVKLLRIIKLMEKREEDRQSSR